jgi:hypothetical protein
MPRPVTTKVLNIKAKLVARIRDGFHQPGDPFLSNRSLAERYGVSYQTAHRLLKELVDTGLLVRRHSSGTYIAGTSTPLTRVALVFHARAKQPGSFGAGLLNRLQRELDSHKIPSRRVLTHEPACLDADEFPVVWEIPAMVQFLANQSRFALLLHNAPPRGIGASYIDSIQIDDYSGGMIAAQILRERYSPGDLLVVVSGPEGDRRSRDRVAGFLEVFPEATVVDSKGWYLENGFDAGPRVLELKPDAVFCCNDRLAEGLIGYHQKHKKLIPPLVGYDNAPIAEALHLTTVAIPWDQYVKESVLQVKKRLSGDSSASKQIILSLRPNRRLSCQADNRNET